MYARAFRSSPDADERSSVPNSMVALRAQLFRVAAQKGTPQVLGRQAPAPMPKI
jgi:hypothetical protein